MGEVPVPGYQTLWTNKFSTLKSQYQTSVQQYPEEDAQLKQLHQAPGDIEDVARHIATSIGEIVEWAAIVNAAEENGASYSKGLHGNPLFSALHGTYTITLHELKAVLKPSTLAGQTNLPKTTEQQPPPEGTFQGVCRRKRNATNKTSGTSKKAAVQTETSPALNIPPKSRHPKHFHPLRAADMDTDASGTEATSNEEAVPGKTGRPPPIILTSTANLI
jgi:hypothetical protein